METLATQTEEEVRQVLETPFKPLIPETVSALFLEVS